MPEGVNFATSVGGATSNRHSSYHSSPSSASAANLGRPAGNRPTWGNPRNSRRSGSGGGGGSYRGGGDLDLVTIIIMLTVITLLGSVRCKREKVRRYGV
jgi:hypothetical protein